MCCPIQTRADTIALSFTPSGQTFFGGAGSITVGWGFSLSSAVDVTQLGVWDENGNGLAQSHMVTIWDSTGTAVAQVTIPSGTGAETNGFRYVSIGSVSLTAGNYTIGALYGAFGSDTASISALAISTAPGVTYAGSRGTVGNAFPGSDGLAYRTATSARISSLRRLGRFPMQAQQFLCSAAVCLAWRCCGANCAAKARFR